MAKTAVINYSTVYNLGAKKIEKWHQDQGDEVLPSNCANQWILQCDKAYLSAIFTTDLPQLCEEANRLKAAGVEVEIGGPAPTALPKYVETNCGIKPHVRLDERFEHVKGNFTMSFTSRGCPNKCPSCIVPKIETESLEYDDFPIPVGNNPIISDNNILATSIEHQQLVVEKLRGIRNIDINSGFEAALFNEDFYKLYSKLNLKYWRLAFDTIDEDNDFTHAVKILKNHAVSYHDIIVYVLIGFPGTTFEDSVYRLEKARNLDCSPYPMLYRPTNRIDSREYVASGFDSEQLKRLQAYWMNPYAWRSCSFEEFQMANKPTPKG
jgi:hypothetical protein